MSTKVQVTVAVLCLVALALGGCAGTGNTYNLALINKDVKAEGKASSKTTTATAAQRAVASGQNPLPKRKPKVSVASQGPRQTLVRCHAAYDCQRGQIPYTE